MPAGDRHGLVRAGVSNNEQCALEAGLDLSYPSEIDKVAAVHPEEGNVRQLPFEMVEAMGSGLQPAPVGCQPDRIAVGFGEADLVR